MSLLPSVDGLVSLSVLASGLWAIPLTLSAYLIALWLYRLSGQSPLVNPVLLGMIIVIGVLTATETTYTDYFDGARLLHFLLGTATVALAIPLYQQLGQLRAAWRPIIASVMIGACVASISAVLTAAALGANETTLRSLVAKSTTTPIAMAITQQLGGLPPLTAVVVIVTGILGAIAGLTGLRWLGFSDPTSRGLAIGVSAHGIGTARALQVDMRLGAYAGLAMGLTSILTALVAPLLWQLLAPLCIPSVSG